MMCDVGHPITHKPSIKACVDNVPSLSNNSSEISVALRGAPEAMHRMAPAALPVVEEAVARRNERVSAWRSIFLSFLRFF
jgi:hypothetical protein